MSIPFNGQEIELNTGIRKIVSVLPRPILCEGGIIVWPCICSDGTTRFVRGHKEVTLAFNPIFEPCYTISPPEEFDSLTDEETKLRDEYIDYLKTKPKQKVSHSEPVLYFGEMRER